METITYDLGEVHAIVEQNERLLMPKALGVVLRSMDSSDEKIALEAAKVTLAMYGKDAPPKAGHTVNVLAAFANQDQMVSLFRGLGKTLLLATGEDEAVDDAPYEVVP